MSPRYLLFSMIILDIVAEGEKLVMRVVSLVTGTMVAAKWKEFEAAYTAAKTGSIPPGLERSFLLKSTAEPERYTIETIWSSREALDAMRADGKPRAVALFEQEGVSPTVEIHEVIETVP